MKKYFSLTPFQDKNGVLIQIKTAAILSYCQQLEKLIEALQIVCDKIELQESSNEINILLRNISLSLNIPEYLTRNRYLNNFFFMVFIYYLRISLLPYVFIILIPLREKCLYNYACVGKYQKTRFLLIDSFSGPTDISGFNLLSSCCQYTCNILQKIRVRVCSMSEAKYKSVS